VNNPGGIGCASRQRRTISCSSTSRTNIGGSSGTGVTWLLTAFLLSASVGTAIIGKLGDMYGKQRLLVWTLVALAAGALLAALSGSLGLLIVARGIQGVAGGIFPLSFGIARDELPADRVAGSIGLMSAILGVRGGLGLVAGGLIEEHLSWHWLFWIPLAAMVLAAYCIWRYVPESGVRSPGRVNWTAAALMTAGMSAILIAIAETSVWGWTGRPTLTSRHPYDMLLSSPVLGIGIGLAFAALGNLIVQAVPLSQTGVASGMNTVLRTLGGALGGQIAATFVAGTSAAGLRPWAGSPRPSRGPRLR
jgi:MFS family permease